jgi:hypothetical protein
MPQIRNIPARTQISITLGKRQSDSPRPMQPANERAPAHTNSLFNDHVPFLFHCANKLQFCPPEHLSPPVHAHMFTFQTSANQCLLNLPKRFPSSSGPAKLQIRIYRGQPFHINNYRQVNRVGQLPRASSITCLCLCDLNFVTPTYHVRSCRRLSLSVSCELERAMRTRSLANYLIAHNGAELLKGPRGASIAHCYACGWVEWNVHKERVDTVFVANLNKRKILLIQKLRKRWEKWIRIA